MNAEHRIAVEKNLSTLARGKSKTRKASVGVACPPKSERRAATRLTF
jgi:hypothetical protein